MRPREIICLILAAVFLVYGAGKEHDTFWVCMAVSLVFCLIVLKWRDEDDEG